MANQYMQEEDDAILKTYNRYPVVLDHGDGAYLYDPEGKKYLDFSAGYAVSSLGYNNKEFNDALKAQIDKMIHTSNLYYNTTCGKAGEDLQLHLPDTKNTESHLNRLCLVYILQSTMILTV